MCSAGFVKQANLLSLERKRKRQELGQKQRKARAKIRRVQQNQPDIVAEAHVNAFDPARATGHLLESCLRRFEKVMRNYLAQRYSSQSVTAFINELWLRRWSSNDNFAVLRMFKSTKPDCHSKSPLILENLYLANGKSSLVFVNTSFFAKFFWRQSQCASPLCMCGSAEENSTHYFFYCHL